MKKIVVLFIVLIVCLTQQSLLAQTKKLEIDFKKKSVTTLDTLEDGDFFQLHIKDINMNLYKVNHVTKDSIIISEAEFPTFEMIGLDKLTTLVEKIQSFSTYALESKKETSKSLFKRHLLITTTNDPYKALITKINDYISFVNNKKDLLTNMNTDIDSLNLSVQTLALSYLIEDDQNLKKKLKANFDISKIIEESEKLRQNIKLSIKEINDTLESYKAFYKNNKSFLDSNNEIKKTNKDLNEAFIQLLSDATKIYTSINSDTVSSWLKSVIHLDNNNVTEYVSLPQQLNGDLASIKIKIEPKKEEYGLPTYQTEVIFPNKQNTYIGIGMGFYHAGLKNEAYSIYSNIDSTEYSLMDENQPAGEIGIAALLHFGWKPFSVRNLGWHITVGPAISVSSSLKTRLAAGVGIAYGKRQMISLDILAIAGYTDRISNLYNTTSAYPGKPEQVTVSELSYSWAIGIGYIYKF